MTLFSLVNASILSEFFPLEEFTSAEFPLSALLFNATSVFSEADYSGRDLEVFKIFSRMNKAAQHKIQPIPVCDIPEEWRE
jgi:NAD+ synthase